MQRGRAIPAPRRRWWRRSIKYQAQQIRGRDLVDTRVRRLSSLRYARSIRGRLSMTMNSLISWASTTSGSENRPVTAPMIKPPIRTVERARFLSHNHLSRARLQQRIGDFLQIVTHRRDICGFEGDIGACHPQLQSPHPPRLMLVRARHSPDRRSRRSREVLGAVISASRPHKRQETGRVGVKR
jgi:hypothetical protein